jgi:hypothetical protein
LPGNRLWSVIVPVDFFGIHQNLAIDLEMQRARDQWTMRDLDAKELGERVGRLLCRMRARRTALDP